MTRIFHCSYTSKFSIWYLKVEWIHLQKHMSEEGLGNLVINSLIIHWIPQSWESIWTKWVRFKKLLLTILNTLTLTYYSNFCIPPHKCDLLPLQKQQWPCLCISNPSLEYEETSKNGIKKVNVKHVLQVFTKKQITWDHRQPQHNREQNRPNQ